VSAIQAIRDRPLSVAGEWLETGRWDEVTAPYDGRLLGRLARADAGVVDRAVRSAKAAVDEEDFPVHARAAALERVARLVSENAEELALTTAAETGKPLKQSRLEVTRAEGTFKLSAVEALKLAGEVVPMDAIASGAGKLGVVIRVPLGVVAAITPFNFPLNLAAHKIGPALAGGNAVVLKPASATPLGSVRLVELLHAGGVPPGRVQLVAGPGGEVGRALAEHPDVAAVSFTGSAEVGWGIRERAPRKHVALELGSNAPLIVDRDGDWRVAADKCAVHGYSCAGQSCISIQRALVHHELAEPFIGRLCERVARLNVGDPLDPVTDVGPLIDARSRERVHGWIRSAVDGGATLRLGGEVNDDGTLQPTVLEEVGLDQPLWTEEAFGPVVAVRAVKSLDEAVELANDSRYGLQAGVYTRDLGTALTVARRLEYGSVLVNEVPTYRADQQPYGGVKESGNTREGPAYAVQALTEARFISLQPA
jgi:acyl-CoA reductase-like NAD-dependent aldehyde dehydrogenase